MSGPPDKYIAIVLTGDITKDLAAINAAADQGYRVDGLLPNANVELPAMLMGNYKG